MKYVFPLDSSSNTFYFLYMLKVVIVSLITGISRSNSNVSMGFSHSKLSYFKENTWKRDGLFGLGK